MPGVGLGTWKSAPGEVGRAVRAAIELGYRHIDCAPIYENEPEVGEAIAGCISDGVVARDDLWVTSKLWNDAHARDAVVPALERTLDDLRLDYVDLYLIHWPVALRDHVALPETGDDFLPLAERPLEDTWLGMEEVRAAGLARHIGVSNFSVRKIEALRAGADVAPEANQVELHPYLAQPALVEYCAAHDVVVTGYSPLGSRDRPERLVVAGEPVLLEDPLLEAIAHDHDATPAQVALAWALRRGTSVIPKSVRPERLEENLEAATLTLRETDMDRLDGLDRHRRYISGAFWAKEGSSYTVETLWDE